MDGPKLYRMEALDFHLGKIADLELRLRAMPKNLLLVRVPASMTEREMRELYGKVTRLTGLEVLVLLDTIEFCRFVEMPDQAQVGAGMPMIAGRSVRLVGD